MNTNHYFCRNKNIILMGYNHDKQKFELKIYIDYARN